MIRFLRERGLKICKGETVGGTCDHKDGSEGTVNELRGSPSNTWHIDV